MYDRKELHREENGKTGWKSKPKRTDVMIKAHENVNYHTSESSRKPLKRVASRRGSQKNGFERIGEKKQEGLAKTNLFKHLNQND